MSLFRRVLRSWPQPWASALATLLFWLLVAVVLQFVVFGIVKAVARRMRERDRGRHHRRQPAAACSGDRAAGGRLLRRHAGAGNRLRPGAAAWPGGGPDGRGHLLDLAHDEGSRAALRRDPGPAQRDAGRRRPRPDRQPVRPGRDLLDRRGGRSWNTWACSLDALLVAIGGAAFIMAFALQDILSNVFSGFRSWSTRRSVTAI